MRGYQPCGKARSISFVAEGCRGAKLRTIIAARISLNICLMIV